MATMPLDRQPMRRGEALRGVHVSSKKGSVAGCRSGPRRQAETATATLPLDAPKLDGAGGDEDVVEVVREQMEFAHGSALVAVWIRHGGRRFLARRDRNQ
jgi:hypothetical protein